MDDDFVRSKFYCCFRCRNTIAFHYDIVNKDFVAGNGRAILFAHAMNVVVVGPPEDRQLISGTHRIADVSCSDCGSVLGWMYDKTYEERHKYKEGKFVFKRSMIAKAADPLFYP